MLAMFDSYGIVKARCMAFNGNCEYLMGLVYICLVRISNVTLVMPCIFSGI